ncbi:MAG: DNA internalization-related competence protein ComEC/Rec2, partial [Pseudomonadota bacterium]
MSHRPLILILLSFAGGIGLGHGASSYQPIFLTPLFIFLLLLVISLLFIPFPLRLPATILLFFLLGILLDVSSHKGSALLSLAEKGERVVMEGTVLQPRFHDDKTARFEIQSHRVFSRGKVNTVRERVLLTIFNHPGRFSAGDAIRFPARLRVFKNFNNPGRYNYESAMGLRGLSCAASVSDGRYIVPMGRENLGFPMQMVEEARISVRRALSENVTQQNQALLRALLLGEREEIRWEWRESFNKTGLGHILAVSGLHIGLVAWLVFALLKYLLSRSYHLTLKVDIRWVAALITCPAVIAYTGLTGFQISGQRAMIMVLAYLFSILLRREKEAWSTLSLAALVVLALDPHALFSASFQLSFGAVIGVLWLAPAFYGRISTFVGETTIRNPSLKTLYSYVTGLVAVTLSATLFLLPIVVFYFHRISLITVPANLTAVPILGLWVIPFGLLGIMILPLSLTLAHLSLQVASWGVDWMMSTILFWADLSWADRWVVTPNLLEMPLFYGLLFFAFFIRRWPWAKVALFIILGLSLLDISYWVHETRFNKNLKVTYLDVGQGNAALIQFPGKERMLIDGGGFSADHFDVGRMVVAPYLWHSKISSIDCLVLTHPQADHMNGLRFIASHFKPKEFWFNGDEVATPSFAELMGIIESKKLEKRYPHDLREGRTISGVDIKILHPYHDKGKMRDGDKTVDLNNNSLVLRLSYQGKTFLFPGDLEKHGEELVVSHFAPLLKSDVLLAPHHGSRTSCSKVFLQMVKPGICVISSGSGHPAGFPHEEALNRLKD